jgi:uncharacterized membrane protein
MKSFFDRVDHDRIVSAIAKAEMETSGEIRVHLHHRGVSDPIAAGKKVFEKIGMTKTAEKNGVLIFVAPRSKNFAILGDAGIHERCGDDFWREAAARMAEHFRKSDFSGGIVATIEKLGDALAAHFPAAKEKKNQLTDEIDEG